MELKTARLVLRPFIKEDYEAVFDIYKNEDTCKYLLHDAWTDENAEEEFEKKLKNNELTEKQVLNLAVTLEGYVIGDISVWYTGMKDSVEIGYSFLSTSSGKGYATEAVKATVNWLFTERNVHRIQANLDARNHVSSQLCERVGMRKEAYFIQDFWNKGEWTDSFVYGMLQADMV